MDLARIFFTRGDIGDFVYPCLSLSALGDAVCLKASGSSSNLGIYVRWNLRSWSIARCLHRNLEYVNKCWGARAFGSYVNPWLLIEGTYLLNAHRWLQLERKAHAHLLIVVVRVCKNKTVLYTRSTCRCWVFGILLLLLLLLSLLVLLLYW